MNERIRRLLEQIGELEEELQSALQEQQKRLLYEIKGRRIEFERNIRLAHRRLRTGLLRWVLSIRPRDLLTLPIIYGMFFPLLLLDLSVTLYQRLCFPIYGIRLVRRSDYIAFDHRFLAYLNIFEKLNCLFCSYANGLIAYAREIAARTEQYFCPIKHARKLAGHHAHYARFVDYGDAGDLYPRIEKLRDELRQEESAAPPEERN